MKRPVLDACNLSDLRIGDGSHPLDRAAVKLAWLCDNFNYSNLAQAREVGGEVIRLLQQVTEATSAELIKRRIP